MACDKRAIRFRVLTPKKSICTARGQFSTFGDVCTKFFNVSKHMPRDSDTLVSIDFENNPLKKERSQKQDDQLSRARLAAIKNRKIRAKKLCEERLMNLRQSLGDLHNDQLEKVVGQLIQTEEHHRSKLNSLVESWTQQIQSVHEEMHKMRKAYQQDSKLSRATVDKSVVGTLSDVSTIRR